MSQQSVTYEDLKKDSKFLNAAYSTLRGLGENVSKNPEEIVDTFLTKRRWFNANLGSTISQSNDILNDFTPRMLKDYQYAVDQIDAVPNFGEGSAPKWEAATDYIKAAVELEETTGNITKCVVSLVVEKDGSVSNVQLPRGVFVNADTEQEKIVLENTLNSMIIETVEGLNFVLPAYQNGEKARVMLQFSASVNY